MLILLVVVSFDGGKAGKALLLHEPCKTLRHNISQGMKWQSRIVKGNVRLASYLCQITSNLPLSLYVIYSFEQLKRRSLDPILLNQQTLELREHLHGPADIVLVAEEVRFAAHRSVLVEVRAFVCSLVVSLIYFVMYQASHKFKRSLLFRLSALALLPVDARGTVRGTELSRGGAQGVRGAGTDGAGPTLSLLQKW